MKESKVSEVKAYFEDTDNYQKFDYNLRIRAEEVENWVGNTSFTNALDMPCGTGVISIPILKNIEKLTMVDVSENMVKVSENNTPADLKHKVTYINNDFYQLDFEDKSFDLILSIGILAHIDDPAKFIERISNLLQDGAHLILQNTDYSHPYSRLIWFYLGMKKLIGKHTYTMNKLTNRQILHMCKANGLELQDTFRYNQSFLGFSNLFSNGFKYRFTRWIWGNGNKKKMQKTGSDYIYHFKKRA